MDFQLFKVLSELNSWCPENSLTPHSVKCEAVLLIRKPHIGPLNSVTIGEDRIEWVKHSRLWGVTIDERLSWSRHLTDVKKNFVNKLNLLKRSSFLSSNALLDFYILWKYFTVGQPELYTTCPEICLPTVYRHSNWNT